MSVTSTAVLFDIIGRDRTGAAMKGAGSAFNKLALGIAAGAAFMASKMIDAAGDFQQGITRLQTGAGELHSNLAMVSSGVLDMMGQVGIGASEATHALYMIESGGQHGADALLTLRAASEGAKAEMADTGEVADALTSVLQDYHLKASSAALVTSQMVTAVGMGKTNFTNFAESLHSVLPIASAAHIAFSDISGAVASMTVHGMSADQATQNLADTIKHMVAPTGVQVKELGQLGLSASNLADMVSQKGLTGTLQYLSDVIIKHMGPSGRVLLNAFNQSRDAAHDADVMIKSMPPNLASLATQFRQGKISLNDWRKEMKALPANQAALMAQFTSLQANASGFSSILRAGGPAAQSYEDALRRVTGDATGLNVALMLTGENAAYTNQAVSAVAGASTEAGNHVKGWSEVQTTFNQRLAQAKGTVGALSIQIGTALLPYAQDMLDVTMKAVHWFSEHKTTAKALAVTMGILAATFIAYRTYVVAASVATKAWMVITKVGTAAQWALNIALDANPIGVVIVAIGLLVAAFVYLWTHSAGFRKFWIGLWADIKGIALGIGHWFAGPFAGFWVKVWHGFTTPIMGAYHWFYNKSVWLVATARGVTLKIIGFFVGIGHGISGAFSFAVGMVRSAINMVIGLINGATGFINTKVIDIANKLPGVNFPHIPFIPSLASGGIVPATPGGRLVRVAEGGQAEAIVPLGRGGAGLGGSGRTMTLRAGDALMRAFVRELAEEIRRQGGDPALLNLKIQVA